MVNTGHRCIAALLMGCMAPLAWAADGASPKLEALRAAWVSTGAQGDLDAALRRAESAAAVVAVSATDEHAVLVELTGKAKWTLQSRDGGNQLIVRLSDAIAMAGKPDAPSRKSLVRAMTVSQHEFLPEPVTQITLDLAIPCVADVKKAKEGIFVVLRAKDKGLAALYASTDTPAARRAATERVRSELEALAAEDTVTPCEANYLEALAEGRPAAETMLRALCADDAEEAAPVLIAAAPDPAPVDERSAQVSSELRALAEIDFDARIHHFVHGAVDEGEAAAPAEGQENGDAPAVEEAAPADEPPPAAPEPPMPREQAPVKTTDANAELAERQLELLREEEAMLSGPAPAAAAPAPATESQPRKVWQGDPMQQPVNIDFREMELANVVALLAHKAGINVIAGADLVGTVTVNLRNVPLRQAMETALRINGLGMTEEEGIYHIVPYEQAVAARRKTVMVTLNQAKSVEIRKVLEEILRGVPGNEAISISANDTANVVVISGPEGKIGPLVDMVHELDIAEPQLATVTEAIKLNFSNPDEVATVLEKMLTPQIGKVAADTRARHVIVTDVPIVVEQMRSLIQSLDVATKQVAIDSMVVDVLLEDDASTGVDWLLSSVRRQSRRSAATGGPAVGNLQDLGLDTGALGLGNNVAGLLNFAVLSSDFDWRGVIQAEVRNQNGKLISNPQVLTVENQPAKIEIIREIPYIELTQTAQGGSQTSTEFKDVGTVLEVTPRVTHDNQILATVTAKESDTVGEFNGIPIENVRQIDSTVRLNDGQTIFLGGLRKNDRDATVRKVPVLGDVPVINLLFRQNVRTHNVNELLVFLTCNVVDNTKLTQHQRSKHSEGANADTSKVNAFNDLAHDAIYPAEATDPVWKWRRAD